MSFDFEITLLNEILKKYKIILNNSLNIDYITIFMYYLNKLINLIINILINFFSW